MLLTLSECGVVIVFHLGEVVADVQIDQRLARLVGLFSGGIEDVLPHRFQQTLGLGIADQSFRAGKVHHGDVAQTDLVLADLHDGVLLFQSLGGAVQVTELFSSVLGQGQAIIAAGHSAAVVEVVDHPQAGAGAVFRIAFRSLVLGGGNGALMQLGQRLNGLLIGKMNGILNIQAGVRPVIAAEDSHPPQHIPPKRQRAQRFRSRTGR